MIGSCTKNNDCVSNYNRFNIAQKQVEIQKFTTIVTINQVRRIDKDMWRIIYIGENIDLDMSNMSCKLRVVIRATNVTCHLQKNTGDVKVACYTSKVFPPAQYHFQVYINGKKHNGSIDEVMCKHENYTDQEEEYFKSNCTAAIPKSIIQAGDYKVISTVSPGGIKNNEDEMFNSLFTLTFVIESPAVALHNCFDYVEEDGNISCECKAVNNTSLKSIKWYDKIGHLLNDGNLLTVTGERSTTEYKCQGTDYLEIKSPMVTYKPILKVKNKQVNCSLQFLKNNVEMTCYTKEICAQARCIFYLVSNRISTDDSKQNYSHHISENFCSPCNLLLNYSYFIQPGQYNIHIFVYNNNTQTDEDMKYVASGFLHFNKDDNFRKEISQALLYPIVSCTVAVLVVIILITSAAAYIVFVKKRSRENSGENNDKTAQGMKTYNKRISLESIHLYQSVLEVDHYDLCDDSNRSMSGPDSTKMNNWQDNLDKDVPKRLVAQGCTKEIGCTRTYQKDWLHKDVPKRLVAQGCTKEIGYKYLIIDLDFIVYFFH